MGRSSETQLQLGKNWKKRFKRFKCQLYDMWYRFNRWCMVLWCRERENFGTETLLLCRIGNEMKGVLCHLCAHSRLNWARRTSWGWWDKWYYLGYERLHPPLCEVADTPFHIQEDLLCVSKMMYATNSEIQYLSSSSNFKFVILNPFTVYTGYA